MKKGTKIALITAGALMILGVVLCGVAWASCGFSLAALSTTSDHLVSMPKQAYDPAELEKIVLDCGWDDVEIHVSEDEYVWVQYSKWNDWIYLESMRDGVLKFEKVSVETPHRWWENFFRVDFTGEDDARRTLHLWLPAGGFAGNLEVTTDSGNVEIDPGIRLEGGLDCQLSAGEFEAEDLEAGRVSVDTDLGDISGRNWTIGEDVALTTNAGGIELEKSAIGGALHCETDLGDVETLRVTAASTNLRTNAGEVTMELMEAPDITIETDMGDVEGSITGREADYTILVSTDLGESNLRDRQ
jgi:hypothetical protein